MQSVSPDSVRILIAENENEFSDILDHISASSFDTIKEISHFFSKGLVHVYVVERSNILIVKYAGDFNENVENIIADFYVVNGFNY